MTAEISSDHVFRCLKATDCAAFQAHLLRLDPTGRYNRFSATASDEMIAAYVARSFAGLCFSAGFFHSGTLRGVVEAHCMTVACADIELAFSIEWGWRGHGAGHHLFAMALAEARRRAIKSVYIHCLAHNFAMVALMRHFGARIIYEDRDASGIILL